jgi:hypothetical protein
VKKEKESTAVSWDDKDQIAKITKGDKQKRFAELTSDQKVLATVQYILDEEQVDMAVVGEHARTMVAEGRYSLELGTVEAWFNEMIDDWNRYKFTDDGVEFSADVDQ